MRFVVPFLVAAVLAAGAIGRATAQEATPVGSPVPLGPFECTVEPPPAEELRALATTGYATASAFVRERQAAEGTPAAATPDAAGTPAAPGTPTDRTGGEPAATPSAGTPADAATTAAVTETIEQFVACSADGNLPATAAVLTETGGANYLGFAVLTFVQVSTGATTPPAELDPALLDAFLAAVAFPVPASREAQLILYEVREVVVLPDGRVRANVLVSAGDREPGQDTIVLREQDGRYRIEFGDERDDGSGATPTAATPVA